MREDQYLQAAGLKRLNPWWAKTEIVLGLAMVVLGLVMLRDRTGNDFMVGSLIVLGAYLAMAGHRSHLYQAMNRQGAFFFERLKS